MFSVSDAPLHIVKAYAGGAESLAPRMGISANILRNKVNPNCDTHHVRLDEAVLMQELTGDHQILMAMAAHFQYVCIPDLAVQADDNQDLMVRFNALFAQVGKFASDTNESIADGELDSRERALLMDDVQTAVRMLHEVFSRVVKLYSR